MWNFARRNEHERLKSFLLEHSNDIDIEYCPVDGQGSCALLIAAGKGYYEIAELLIQYGSDTNAQNKDLESPLHRICGRGTNNILLVMMFIWYWYYCLLYTTKCIFPICNFCRRYLFRSY